MRFPRTRGSTSVMVRIFIPDNSVTTGAGCTGLTYASTNLAIAFSRSLQNGGTEITGANIVDITTIGTWAAVATGKIGFKAVDAAKFPGLYELHFANDCVAFGTSDLSDAVYLNIYEKTTTALKIGPNMVLIPLTPLNYQDGTRLGLTALPNAAADAAGGLPISDAGGLDVDAKLANTNEVTAARMGALTDWINGGRLDLLLDAIKAITDQFVFTVANKVNANAILVAGAAPDDSSTIAAAVRDISNASPAAGSLGEGINSILTDTGTTLDGKINAVKAETDPIVSGAIATDAGNSATTFKTTLTSAVNDFWNRCLIKITSGALAGQVDKVIDYDGTNKIITVQTGFTSTPADDVTFALINR